MSKRSIIFLIIFVTVVAIAMALSPVWWKIEDRKRKPVVQNSVKLRSLRALPRRKDRKTIVFGASLSMTGRLSVEGQRVKEGYDIWKDWVNKRGGIRVGDRKYLVDIVYLDDRSNSEIVRQNIRSLILDHKVDFLLGPFSSSLTLVASETSESFGVIMVEGCGASEIIFTRNPQFTFAVLTSASFYMKNFFEMMCRVDPTPTTYALVVKDRLFSRSVAKGARIWAAKIGFQEVYYAIHPVNCQDYYYVLNEIKKVKPDMLIFSGYIRDSINFTSELVTKCDFIPKAVIMTLGPTQEIYIKKLGKYAENMMGVTQWVERSNFSCPVFGDTKTYVETFIKKYGHHPTYQNLQATACGIVYQIALEKCTRLVAKEVLENIRNIDCETVFGRIKFDARGMNIAKSMAIVQIQDGQRYTIWPLNLAERPIAYPLKGWLRKENEKNI